MKQIVSLLTALFILFPEISTGQSPVFTDIGANLTGVHGGDVQWGDFDNDGDLDVLVSGYTDMDPSGRTNGVVKIYRNDGNDSFWDLNAIFNVPGYITGHAAWADIDKDGDLDVALIYRVDANVLSNHYTKIFNNEGTNSFTDIGVTLTGGCNATMAWEDFNNDGFQDLFVQGDQNYADYFANVYRNIGDYTFSDINAGLQGCMNHNSAGWGDFNNDAYPDLLYVGFSWGITYFELYKNNKNETFTGLTTSIPPGMTTWIDFDKDGYLDLISASSTNSHAIYLNNKNESFLPTDVHFPVWPTMGGDGAVISGDFNSDGFSDTFFTGTYNYFSELYENNAGTSFTLVSNNGLIPLASSDAAFGDYNGDGLLDLIIQGWDGSQNVTRIYKNTLNGNQPFSCGDPVLYEGQTYNTVQIGTQCWFRENLNVGTKINVGQNQTDNGIIEKHCYDNLESNCTTYGGLYSWHELMDYNSSESVQGICPPGWHIPSNSEMCTMMTFLDPTVNCSNTYTHIGTDVGGKLKETGLEHWNEPNTGASNSSGFSALGSGYGIDGSFTNLKTFTHFYTSTYVNGSGVYVHRLDYNTQDVFYQFGPDYSLGASHPVRCVREAGISYLNLPDSIIECISDSIKLDGTPGFKDYLWSTGETSQTIWVKTNGVYKLQVKDNYNNIQTDSTYVNLLNFDLVASDTSLCSGESATLQVIIHEQPVDTLPKCLVAYYPFNGNANDESGNGHHGTNYGASLTADRFGNPNSAYYFNGNAMIEIVDAPDLNVPTGKISISAWAYKIGNYTQGHIIGKRTLCAYFQYQIGFWLGAAGIGWGGSGSYLENVLFDFPSEVWIHFVGTFDGLTWKLYQNGILVGSLDAPLPSPVPEPLLIGNSGSCQYFIGNIDDVRIYDCALTDSEILQLYNSGTKKKDQYLISWTTGENSEVIQVSPLGETTYGVTVSDGINSCYQEITIHSANPDLAFEVSPSQGYAPLTVNFNYTGQDDFLRWDFGDGQMDYVHKSTSHVYDSAGTYYSKVFVNTGDPDSCTAFDFAIIQVFENPTLEIPDFFTPNADGFNDYFYVKSTGMQAMNVKIYDPWGDFIYEIKDVEGKWDGMTEQGKEAPEGTYYYYLAATALDKEILERKGSVLLIRDEINAYPNPAIESLNINLNGTMSGNIRVDILNVQGVRIRSGSMNASNEVKIDISGLPHGFYILKMDDNKNQRYTSFIKR